MPCVTYHLSPVTYHLTTTLCSFSCYKSPRRFGVATAGDLVCVCIYRGKFYRYNKGLTILIESGEVYCSIFFMFVFQILKIFFMSFRFPLIKLSILYCFSEFKTKLLKIYETKQAPLWHDQWNPPPISSLLCSTMLS